MDHFEDSPWIYNMVLGGWIIFQLFFEIGYFVGLFAVSRCRLFKEVLSCHLHFIASCPRTTTREVPRPT